MVFSSPLFLFLFLPLVLAAYFIVRRELRNSLLLVASLGFYAWGEYNHTWVLLTSIGLNYGLGLVLGSLKQDRFRSVVIALVVAANLGILGFCKYANFLTENINGILGLGHLPRLALKPVHLPLGISFFTFHALSYVIDIYRRKSRPLKNPIDFALYISFFPQAIAGPIVRYGDIWAQLLRRRVTRSGFAQSVERVIIGLAKKMLVANTLAQPADAIFGLPASELGAATAWVGLVCYTLQIYFDFSGYSDMAIGLARMFGFEFKENFNYPYTSVSVTDFWRRWHISLSTWYRDYLYIPLGGNRCGRVRRAFNLLTVFFLCGLWHGASWTFVVWGLYHGAFLALERTSFGRWTHRLGAPMGRAYTLLAVMSGWVFFRATSIGGALAFLGSLVGLGGVFSGRFPAALYLTPEVVIALAAGVLGSTPVVPLFGRLKTSAENTRERGWTRRILRPALAFLPPALQAILLLASTMQLASGTYNPFIYYRF